MLENTRIIDRLKVYYDVTEVPCRIIDFKGETQEYIGEDFTYCSIFEKITKDKCPCKGAHLHASKQAERFGEVYIFNCPAGLTHWTIPLVKNGVFHSAIVAGPVQMTLPSEFMINNMLFEYEIPIENKGLFKSALKMIPVIEPKKVKSYADLLYIVAKEIMNEHSKILQDRKEKYKEQAIINEEIQYIKTQDSEVAYPIMLERELVNRVKRADKEGAKAYLNDILGHILFSSGNNLEMSKVRLLELIIILSRSAVEGGAKLENIFESNREYMEKINKQNNIEELCHWIIKVLDGFLDEVLSFNSSKNVMVIQKAIQYINDNYQEGITLEQVSKEVYLSTAYFSRLFKEEMDISFSEYLNKVRVEESKRLLLNLKYSLSDIAHQVGFSDQSYFTKVFKRIEGISPGQYRKTNI